MNVVRILVVIGLVSSAAFAQGTRLLREPTISQSHVVFAYGGDLWRVARSGGDAVRLTTSEGIETNPEFSPDGNVIAFSGEYDGNLDVFTIPTEGGQPTRLTFHGGGDSVIGWHPDGDRVLFSSGRDNPPDGAQQLWTISTEGGMPERLSLPMASYGAYSGSGDRMAYVPLSPAYRAWRHYRGGRTTAIWLVDMDDLSIEMLPRENSNDYFPMWSDSTVYFVSDREGTMNLFSYDVNSEAVTQRTDYEEYDIKSASLGEESIVFEQEGYLHVYDLSSGESEQLEVNVRGDLPWARSQMKKAGGAIRSAHVSPTGKRAVVEARGDVFTVPAKKGDVRSMTGTSDAHDRSPIWSPDGKQIAWLSDASGEYELLVSDSMKKGEPRVLSFDDPSFYYLASWSPDSKHILYTDKHLNVWVVDVESEEHTKIGSDTYSHPERSLNPVWAPDSKWVAYAARLENQFRAIFVYGMETGATHQLSDGLSDAISPTFDRNGKYLYFLASTNFSRSIGWLDMSSYESDVTRGMYLAVLSKDEPSPLLPESDEEEVEEEEAEEEEEGEEDSEEAEADAEEGDDEESEEEGEDIEEEDEGVEVIIDFEGLDQRILAVNIPVRSYTEVEAGPEGVIFYTENVPGQSRLQLHKYTLEKRESAAFLKGVSGFHVSANGKKLLYAAGSTIGIVGTDKPGKVGDGKLKTSSIQVKVDPREEWRQIFLESWRIKRDFFYDETLHGVDWPAMYDKYTPLLDHVAHRSDLTYVLNLLIGETVSGHTRTGGGDRPVPDRVDVGLLGVDWARYGERFRIERIYEGENWNPSLRAPLSAPGVDVSEGDYLIAVNGNVVDGSNVYAYFEGTSGKQTTLTLSASASGDDARTVTVVPIGSERSLRQRTWMEANRKKVDEASGGRLAYVYLPDTSQQGYTNFNRYYYAQQHKEGIIIDERFNHGGSVADYMVDFMDRPLLSYWATRDGREFTSPNAAIFGPKVMIINENAGSGGDFLPWAFRKRGIGPIVGKRTWGGLIGVYDYPVLIDGGSVTAPRLAIYDPSGEWIVENVGVPADIEVDQTPEAFAAGGDPQLEAAIQEAMRLLEESTLTWTERPAPINRMVE